MNTCRICGKEFEPTRSKRGHAYQKNQQTCGKDCGHKLTTEKMKQRKEKARAIPSE